MAKFCGRCGHRLDPKCGLCPQCDKGKIWMRRLVFPAALLLVLACVAVWALPKKIENNSVRETTVLEVTEAAQWPQIELVTDALFDDTFAETHYNSLGYETVSGYYHIPKINLNLPGIQKINDDIYRELYGILEADGFPEQAPCMYNMAYSVAEKGDIISILVCFYDRFNAEYWDEHQYAVYNVNRKTGEYVTDDELLEDFGYTLESFRNYITGALTNKTHEFFMNNGMFDVSEDITQMDEWTQEWYMKLWNESISEENKDKVMPYIDAATGDLCIAATIPVINSDGRESATINLSGTTEPVDPEICRDITEQWGDNSSQLFNNKLDISKIWAIQCEINGNKLVISYLLQEYGKAYCAVGLEYSDVIAFYDGTYSWKDNVITFTMNIAGEIKKYSYSFDAEKMQFTQVSEYSPFSTQKRGTVLQLSDKQWVTREAFDLLIKNGLQSY